MSSDQNRVHLHHEMFLRIHPQLRTDWWHGRYVLHVIERAQRLQMVLDAPTTPRMVLKAYVCGPGCVHRVEDEGSSLFSQVYQRRPPGCRYAVVEIAPATIWVLDMYSTKLLDDGLGVKPGDYTVYTDIDAAIMATALNY